MTSEPLWQAARIVEDDDGRRWLEFASPADCARCRAGRGCGAAQWARLFGDPRAQRLPLPAACTLPPGSTVRAGMSARAVLRAAALAYLAPLLAFVMSLVALDALAVGEAQALALASAAALITLLAARRGVRSQLAPCVEAAPLDCSALESEAG
ncbi:hypothetical protein HFP89_04395 [Wenzhouxiangella sp. XN79A]|uniref:SoxR reducing system RseC family protein n=1 Tax=Wenzhouxiangella sp. XN79A TaxID=2724193 RepID=UPI00144AE126|nr:SoxR reducing system RseC family protein [Wenzhouxiangella sp. XN79A]NKI34400.1 hypothetical protein [Wenzhouxiangella sp. XN79A]